MGPIHSRNGFTNQNYLNLKNSLQDQLIVVLFNSFYRGESEKSVKVCKYLVLGSLADYPRFTRLRSSHLKVIKTFLKPAFASNHKYKKQKKKLFR